MQTIIRLFTVLLVSCLGADAAADQSPPAAPQHEEASAAESVIVTFRHLNGDKETVGQGLDSMDLIFDGTGQLVMVHMVLLTQGKPDTHRWLPMHNLASFNYRIVSRLGRGKIRIRTIQTIDKDHSEGVAPSVPDDYR